MLGNKTIKYGLRILFVLLAFILIPRMAMAQVTKKKPVPVPTKPVQKTPQKKTEALPQHGKPPGKGESGKTDQPDKPGKGNEQLGNDTRATDRRSPENSTTNHNVTPAPKAEPKFTPPRDAKATPEPTGMKYTSSKGEFHTGPKGKLNSVRTPSGTDAKFNSRGGVATIHPKNGPTIQSGSGGARRIDSTRADGAKVVGDGRGGGYVEKNFTHGGQKFSSRTYVVNGHVSTRVYRQVSYGGRTYYRYVPGYYYAPAFYGWAYNPWVTPVAFGWGWGYAGWYGFYGGYFGAEPFYTGPNFWLTDYVLAADLQAAYAEQVGASAAASGPGVTIPGNQAWTDTGKYLNAGDQVSIAASGAVTMGGGWAPLPPSGKNPNCGTLGGFPAGELPCWSLIGRVGDGPIFEVGNGRKITAQNSGELLLGVNDNILGDNSGNWYATIVAPGADASAKNEQPSAKPSDAALDPLAKQEIAEQTKAQIAADQDAAANPSRTANDDQIPAALDPKHTVFIVSSTLSEQMDDGQPCSLTGGDILTRIGDAPDANQNVRVLVTSAKKDDCAVSTKLAMSIQDLQDMYNDFQAKLDDGLKQLAATQGKKGIPGGPAAGGRVNPDGVADPDANAAASIQEQEQAANKAEGEVDQATQPTGGN
jgi:hypothetical protein